MGYWQLSRLYQCFSKESSHTNLGYPKCLFMVMYLIGGGATFGILCIIWFLRIDNCHINGHYMYHEQRGNILSPSQSFGVTIFGAMLATILLFWDWITLTLYIVKLRKFMKLNSDSIAAHVKQRVKEILTRIIICTCLYESVFFLMIISRTLQVFIKMDYIFIPLGQLLPSLIILSFSYSMYLMQEHNTEEYYHCLDKINVFLCCCLKKRMHLSELPESSNMEKQKNGSGAHTPTNTYNTNDLSQNHGRVNHVEMSIDSTKIVYNSNSTS